MLMATKWILRTWTNRWEDATSTCNDNQKCIFARVLRMELHRKEMRIMRMSGKAPSPMRHVEESFAIDWTITRNRVVRTDGFGWCVGSFLLGTRS